MNKKDLKNNNLNNNDFENNDTLTIYVKQNKAEDIKQYYSLLGWEVVNQTENKRYEDLLNITFIRKHKIKNKDELQLMQIYVEENLNEQGKLDKNKYPKTISSALCFGIIGLAFLTFAMLIFYGVLPPMGIIAGTISLVIGLTLISLWIILVPQIFKKEKIYYAVRSAQIKEELELICKKASNITGGGNEKNK